MKFLSALGWILIIAVAVTWWNTRGTEPTTPAQCGSANMAFTMSQRAVRRELLNPDGARFPRSLSGNDARVVRTGECTFRVQAWVDAQNAFGATIRRGYSIEMRYNPQTRNWTPSNLQMN